MTIVFRNGKPLNEADFEGVSEEARTEALRRYREKNRAIEGSTSKQGADRLTFGTPRKGKNTGFAVNGVRVR